MAQIIDGKKISAEIKDELKEKAAKLKEKGTNVIWKKKIYKKKLQS